MKKIFLMAIAALMFSVAANAQVKTLTDKQVSKMKLERPMVIDFYADWCGPCRAFGPIYEKAAEEYGEVMDFYRMNVDTDAEYFRELGGSAIPFIVFIYPDSDGVWQVTTHTGYMEATVLEEYLDGTLDMWNAQ